MMRLEKFFLVLFFSTAEVWRLRDRALTMMDYFSSSSRCSLLRADFDLSVLSSLR